MEFRRLLEQLEQRSKASADGDDVTTPAEFEDAVRRAEGDFGLAMDLRRLLEEAFRKGQP